MRRFHWPLQRLLDVTAQREKVLRAELLNLSRQIARLRQQVLWRQAALRQMLEDLAAEELPVRIRNQPVVMDCSQAQQTRIDRLEEQLADLGRRRSQKTEQLVKVRGKRQTLERLRQEAWQGHVRQELKLEQRQFDEIAHVGKARRLIESARQGA